MAKKAILLDTCFFVDHMKAGLPGTIEVFSRINRGELTGGFSVLTDYELWAGISNKNDERRHKLLLRDLSRYPLTVTIAHRAGYLFHTYKKIGFIKAGDAILAATALEYNLTLCSKDKHFEIILGLSLERY